jgi:hypothetical protein
MKINDPSDAIGQFFGGIELELCVDPGVSRPRIKPVTIFSESTRVEFPRQLREIFPIGTRFKATVKVCQKSMDSERHGPPYLKAYDIAVIAPSIPEEGLLALVRKGSISGLAYDYRWVTKRCRAL